MPQCPVHRQLSLAAPRSAARAPTLTDIILYISTRIDILWKQRYIFDNGKYISEAEYISGAACTAWLLCSWRGCWCVYLCQSSVCSVEWSCGAGASPLTGAPHNITAALSSVVQTANFASLVPCCFSSESN